VQYAGELLAIHAQKRLRERNIATGYEGGLRDKMPLAVPEGSIRRQKRIADVLVVIGPAPIVLIDQEAYTLSDRRVFLSGVGG
jgi:hypothetical protein